MRQPFEPDVRLYCAQEEYDRLRAGKQAIGCTPETRNELLQENREEHKDLNVLLALDMRKYDVLEFERSNGWYYIRKIERKKMPKIGLGVRKVPCTIIQPKGGGLMSERFVKTLLGW